MHLEARKDFKVQVKDYMKKLAQATAGVQALEISLKDSKGEERAATAGFGQRQKQGGTRRGRSKEEDRDGQR